MKLVSEQNNAQTAPSAKNNAEKTLLLEWVGQYVQKAKNLVSVISSHSGSEEKKD